MVTSDQNTSQIDTPKLPIRVSHEQEQLLNRLFKAASVFGFLAAIAGTADSLQSESASVWSIFLYWISFAIVVVFAYWKKSSYSIRAWVFVGLLFLLGSTDFLDEGLNGSSQAFLLSAIFAASLLLGNRSGIVILVLSVFVMLGFSFAYANGYLINPNDIRSAKISEWIPGISVIILAGMLVISSLNQLIPQFITALGQSRSLADELRTQQSTLEQQIRARTLDLEKRIHQLEITARITQQISTIQQLDLLLLQSVQLIADHFRFYHVGIFLLDEARDHAVLRASNSPIGEKHISDGFRVSLGDASLISSAIERSEARFTLSDEGESLPIINLEYPDTLSELALPLRAEGKIIGAVNIHSTEASAFSREDAIILQLLTDQIALAIDNTLLYQQTHENLATSQRAFAQSSYRAWQQYLQTTGELRERFDPYGILSPQGQINETSQRALRSGELALGNDGSPEALAIPIKERGQIIGYMYAHKPRKSGKWSPEEIELANTLRTYPKNRKGLKNKA